MDGWGWMNERISSPSPAYPPFEKKNRERKKEVAGGIRGAKEFQKTAVLSPYQAQTQKRSARNTHLPY